MARRRACRYTAPPALRQAGGEAATDPMTQDQDFEIFLATAPGLEPVLAEEVAAKGFRRPRIVPGGVLTRGRWPEVWRANLWIRGASRVLARVAAFRVTHLAHLDALARRVPWAGLLRPDIPFRVEAACTKSRLYHSGAVAQRIAAAIAATTGAPEDPQAEVAVMARIERDLCTLSLDTSGEPLHRRGFKQEVNAAPLRETLAALFLRHCGFAGEEPVFDPMCGSGTFVIEAAEIAARLNPGRARSFAFERLATFDAAAWARMRAAGRPRVPAVRFWGRDRDAGAIAISRANAQRAGVSAFTVFTEGPISAAHPPEGPPGLVITNPPYGARLGQGRNLLPLYQALGATLLSRFRGWRVGILATDHRLAEATGLPFLPPGPPVPHGGLRVTLFRTAPLP
jgi:putative N6-adenine-specific DNA methylase